MEILVCIKQVVDDSVEIFMNHQTNKPALENVTQIVNAFDTYALEMATRLKEKNENSNICVLSLGDNSTMNSLKNCLAVGADDAFIIKDELYQEKETITTAKNLANGIKKLEENRGKKFDIIFCGKESTDFASGQVGIMLAKYLNYHFATNLVDIEKSNDKILAKRETEEGYQKISMSFPCLVTVNKPNYEPRYPTIKSKMVARKKVIDEVNLELDKNKLTTEIKLFSPVKKEAGIKIKEGTTEEIVEKIIKKMIEDKII